MKGEWLSEADVMFRYKMTVGELDTFHSIYERKHQDTMPQFAKRRQAATKGKGMTAEQALAKFPIGLKVARKMLVVVGDALAEDARRYELGTVVGFKSPWWRVQYTNGECIDMNKTELMQAVQQYDICKQRGNEPSTEPQPTSIELLDVPVQQLPADFGREYCGETVELMFTTGWAKGVLERYIRYEPQWTFKVMYEGDSGPRKSTLFPHMYTTAEEAEPGAWHGAY